MGSVQLFAKRANGKRERLFSRISMGNTVCLPDRPYTGLPAQTTASVMLPEHDGWLSVHRHNGRLFVVLPCGNEIGIEAEYD